MSATPIRSLAAALVLALAAGCAAPPPTSRRVAAHGAADAGGTLLVVDVCLNYSPLGSDDYFVLANARDGAGRLEEATLRFLDAADVRQRTRLVPFVCGALHDQAEAAKRVAEAVDAPVEQRPQPLWVAPELAGDAEYVAALQVLATHVFRTSVAAYDKDKPAPADPAPDPRVQRAAALVAQRSGRTSLLYVGVSGHSLSSGKAATFGVARVVAGVAISVGIGPVFTAGGTQYGVIFMPGGPVDKRQMAAGVFDLREGRLVKSRVVGAGGDPMKPEVLAERNALNLLLSDMLLDSAR